MLALCPTLLFSQPGLVRPWQSYAPYVMSNIFCGDTTPPNSRCLPSCLQWRGLVKKDKEFYENKARRIAEEQAAKQEAAERAFNDSLNMFPVSQSPMSSNDARMSPASAGGRMTPSSGGQMMTSGQGRIVDRRDTGRVTERLCCFCLAGS